MKTENNLRELSNSIKQNHKHIIGIPKSEKIKMAGEKLLEEVKVKQFS